MIFEKRNAAYIPVCEQRIAENQGVPSEIVEMPNKTLRLQCQQWF